MLLTVLCTVIFLRRRASGWRNLEVQQPFPIDEEKARSDRTLAALDAPPPTSVNPVASADHDSASNEPAFGLAEYLGRLEARFRRIEALTSILRRVSIVGGQSVGSRRSARSAPPAYSDAVSLS